MAPTVLKIEPNDDTSDVLMGMAPLMTMAMNRVDLTSLAERLLKRAAVNADVPSANALMDLSVIMQLFDRRAVSRTLREKALRLQQLYRIPAKRQAAIRLLAIKGPGEIGASTPLEFLVEDSDIELHLLHIEPGLPLPKKLPEHDVMFVGMGESEVSLPLLKALESVIHAWPVPVLNRPDRIARLSRDSVSGLLCSVPGIAMPVSSRMNRETLQKVGLGGKGIEFPVIIRPVDSHAGKGLIKAENGTVISNYLQTRTEDEFYIAPFVDYRSEDGLFRKYRLVLIDGRPYAVHMAISDHWMIHYMNAGMGQSAAKRSEEERFMARFDEEFASRHNGALRAVAERMGLDYLVIDCAETRDGQLLIFEVDSSAVVHAMDPIEIFPYKKPQMRKVFDAFRAMLVKAVTCGTGCA